MDILFDTLIEHGKSRDALPLNKHPDGFNAKLKPTEQGDVWEYWANGTAKEIKVDETVYVSPFAFYVKYNGWPAGILKIRRDENNRMKIIGEFAAGQGANEDEFIKALNNDR